jgi:hypothetical protein
MEALVRAGGRVPQRPRQRGEDLQLGGRERVGAAHVPGGAGQPGQEQRLGLLAGESGEPRPVAADQPVPAAAPLVGVDRHPGGRQRLHVPVDGALGHLQLARQLGGGHRLPRLQEEHGGDQSGGAHGDHPAEREGS